MNRSYNHITVDSPNIPLVGEHEDRTLPFGEFVPFRPVEMESVLGPVNSQDMYLPNFTVRAFEGRMTRDAVFYDQQGTGLGMLGSCIFFKGKFKTFVPGKTEGIISYNGSHNFKFDPNNEFRHLCLANTELDFLHFSYSPRFLHQLLPENERWAEVLQEKIERKERVVGDRFAPISLAQEQALANIFNTPLTGKLGYMMIETSIIQVILLQMYSLFHKEEAFKEPSAGKRDIELMQELKNYLNSRFLDDHTISGLAQQFGTNSNKLMTLFKKLFGKSIFEYLTDQRMEHARKLLQEEGLLVTEVSRNIGYKNPNHFSTAFKRRFGVNPSVYGRRLAA
jgi:AraC-like DNA-binding protein